MRLVIGVTGASGAIFGVRTLQVLKSLHVETHLVMSKWARTTIASETDFSTVDVEALASFVYHPDNQSAAISSGSFRTSGMIVAPCSMKTLAAIRSGICDSLISRAADVTLKERRKLVLMVRESPLSEIHLDNMLALSRMGAVILPPVPAFYSGPKTLDEMVDHIIGRLMDQFELDMPGMKRWNGFETSGAETR